MKRCNITLGMLRDYLAGLKALPDDTPAVISCGCGALIGIDGRDVLDQCTCGDYWEFEDDPVCPHCGSELCATVKGDAVVCNITNKAILP